jgi:RHS repeat-associated protein
MSHTSSNYANFISFTDPDLQTVSVTNDNKGRRTSVTDRLGDKISLTYHSPSGYVASETNAAGNTTSYTWTAQEAGPFTFFNLTQVHYADSTSQSFTYDAHGNALSTTDQAGKVWKFAYNNRGQVTSATDPLGRVTAYVYNSSDATLASTTDAAGNNTAYSYDSLKRVSQITFADSSTRSFTYDNRDNLLTVTNERGKTTAFAYNANNQVQAVTDALGKSSSVGYDTNDHAQKLTDRTGQSTLIAKNALQLTNSITTPAGEIYEFAYDTHNRLASAADPLGRSFSFAYDKEDVPASMTDALSRKLSFTTNKLGHVTQITTPLSENYAIARDKLERVTSASDPAGVATTLGYDARGALSGIAITGGPSVSMSRDASGLLTGIIDPNGGAWGLSYDGAGRLGSRADPLQRTTSYSYDKRNRVAAIQTPLGTATFTYDAAGNLTGRAYSDGTNLGYTFDADNRLTAASGLTLSYDAEARVTGSNGLVIGRDANGRISSISYGPGKTASYTYNPAGLLASVSDWISGSTTFTYDGAHELIAMKRPNGLGTQFTYDADGRIASIAEDAGSSIAIKRDGAGRVVSENRTQPQPPAMAPGVLPLGYDAADQVSGFGYDGMGRVTSDILHTYTWDFASRLTQYSGAGGSASVAYDALGMRTSLTSQGATQNFIWNYATGLPSLATVQNSSGNSNIDQRYYVYTPDGMLLYAIDASNNARHFYHFDEMGSTVLLTNDAGAVTDSYGITPYGETVSQNGSTPNPFTWLGRFGVMQETTGLYYMRARYYDPATARFLSPDPIISANPMRANPYQYALANPIGIVDPDGQGPRDDDDETTMDGFAGLFALFAVGYVDPEYINPRTGQPAVELHELPTLPALETNAPSTFHVNPAESQEGLPSGLENSPVRTPRLPTTAADGTTSFSISMASGPTMQPIPSIEMESGPTDEQSQAALNFLNVLVRLRRSSPCGPALYSIRTGGNVVDPTRFRQTFWNTNGPLP